MVLHGSCGSESWGALPQKLMDKQGWLLLKLGREIPNGSRAAGCARCMGKYRSSRQQPCAFPWNPV